VILAGLIAFFQQVQSGSERFRAELGRHNYVTPTSYLELLSAFKLLLESKRGENYRARKRYTVGLEKLQGSADQVCSLPSTYH
jgi:dynein heavy chain